VKRRTKCQEEEERGGVRRSRSRRRSRRRSRKRSRGGGRGVERGGGE